MHEILTDLLIVLALVGIAVGRLPRLRMNRATIALFFAVLLVASGAISLSDAGAAIDLGTISLLFAMMLIIANLRLSGFFSAASAAIITAAKGPRELLGLVVVSAGFLAALFLNDTVCIMLTPLVVEICIRSRRDPLPYLVAIATAANVGSCATIIGNPQNMLIGISSGISFSRFFLMLAPPSLLGLAVVWLVIVLAFPGEFRKGSLIARVANGGSKVYKPLLYKSVAASVLMLALLFAGVAAPLAGLIGAALLIFTRRVKPERIFAEVDFSLLVFFCGLFVITRTIESTRAFAWCVAAATPILRSGGGFAPLAAFSGLTALFSNLISNVPTVMLFKPFVALFPNAEKAWLVLAMASTYAGNLTLLGSVANLIVAESGKARGVNLSFGAYLKAGLPITLITIGLGTLWLALV
jgi:Na+/H+ antiporter NhaD/arsenite permease-like protein